MIKYQMINRLIQIVYDIPFDNAFVYSGGDSTHGNYKSVNTIETSNSQLIQSTSTNQGTIQA